ncbi:MAG: DEAD/DEAH box helicase [Anaerolineae bacterium]|uniref:DEAD/DEAH box helicase n=1 Tax=Candidatus Amarolinea dominans TaxID=3140696 RepID=UPI001DF799BD|nr:DEAD/DEAH box helicase [Anaerolineae bacterium]MBK7201953.1 DEAD/DEAH box helicase [Anaerolineae bacterium]MBK9096469.1 DEAD/DEAH box helicase [Anaerolineae bacterium]MBK9233344.1 DEAD/DEAH box helicase [Anaerolineae bacterium]
MSFSQFGLDSRLQQGVALLEFHQPTPIQVAAIPVALTGQDILGSAETGTGKTAAYLLPLLQRLLTTATHSRHPRGLILVPTRELALQVAEQATQLSTRTNLRMATIYGGVSLISQEKTLLYGADVIIATPGRLLDHVGRRNIVFSALEVLVLDEADRMLDVGFLPDLRRIVRLLPRTRQTMLFSATLQPILRLAAEMTQQPVRIEVEKVVTPAAIQQTLLTMPEHLKSRAVQQLLRQDDMQSVLIFARTKHRADRLVSDLGRAGISAAVIHSNRSQSQRIAALEAFREQRTRVLVATDIAARGIDVEGISHVVNYDMPMQAGDYVHRIGRTGRAHASGTAYTFVTAADEGMVHKIEAVLKQKIQRRRLEGIDYDTPALRMPDAEAIRRYVEANRHGGASRYATAH